MHPQNMQQTTTIVDDQKQEEKSNVKTSSSQSFISAHKLYNTLQHYAFDTSYVIFDIRYDKKYFNKCHIIQSVHLNCTKLLSSHYKTPNDNDETNDESKTNTNADVSYTFADLPKSRKFRAWDLSKKTVIIVHNTKNQQVKAESESKDNDNNDNNNNNVSNVIEILKTDIFKKTAISDFKVLNVSFDDFFKQYPFLCIMINDNDENKKNSSKKNLKPAKWESIPYLPNEIIELKLYLGNAAISKKISVMKDLKITHIVNVTQVVKNSFSKKNKDLGGIAIKYLRIAITDTDNTNIIDYFDKTNEFIDNAIEKENGVVLVHCQMGKSRSASVVTAYLMYKYKYTCHVALDYVKQRRPRAQPNDSFVNQLKQYEKQLKIT